MTEKLSVYESSDQTSFNFYNTSFISQGFNEILFRLAYIRLVVERFTFE